jgi:hypothetical protein
MDGAEIEGFRPVGLALHNCYSASLAIINLDQRGEAYRLAGVVNGWSLVTWEKTRETAQGDPLPRAALRMASRVCLSARLGCSHQLGSWEAVLMQGGGNLTG